MSLLTDLSANVVDAGAIMSLGMPPAGAAEVTEEVAARSQERTVAGLPEALAPLRDLAKEARAWIGKLNAKTSEAMADLDDEVVETLLEKERQLDAQRRALHRDWLAGTRAAEVRWPGSRVAKVRRKIWRAVDDAFIEALEALRDLRWAVMIAGAEREPPAEGPTLRSADEVKAFFASLDSDE